MTPTEKETIAQLFDLEKESKQREEENYSQIADLFLEPRASTVGEKWGAAVNVGASNFEADVERYSLMGNVLLGNDNAAKLNEARIKRHEANSAQLSQNFGSFEEFLKEPTFAGFAEQVVTQVGKFVPNAVASAASAVGGMGVGALAKYGLTQTSKRYANKLITDAARRKMSLGTYDVVSREIVERAYKEGRSQAMKRGAIAGAFAQEQFIGTAQSISEYQEAGREITRSEALMANLLGIPQAVVGTFGEVYFAKALFQGALRNTGLGLVLKKVRDGKALSPAQKALHKAWNKLESKKPTTQAERDLIKGALGGKNGKVATFLKDIAVGFTKSGIVEGGTETVQEGLGTLQRFAIDPEYTGEEARLRMAEAAFGGFFAGGARQGIGSAGTSIIRQAREALANKEQALIDLQGRDPNVTPVGETPEQIQGMADGVVRTDNNKDFLWVSNTSVKKPPKVEKEESYTLDNLRGFYKKAQEKARAAQADFDKAVVDIEYSAEERAGIMTDALQADMVDKLAAEDFIKQQYANLPKNNVKAALDEQFAITETSRVFEQIGSERIRKVDYDKLYALNARLLELQDAPVGETPEQKNKRRKEYEKLQEEKAEFIDDLKAGVKYATDRAADQLDNLDLYNNYGQRIVPNFNKAWAKKNNLIVKEYKTGTAYTTNADKIDLLDQSPNDSPDAGSLAVVLNFNSVDTKNHDRVLEVLDEQGRVLKQETTNAEGLDGALLKAKEDYPTVTKLEEGGRSGGYTWQVRALDEVVRDRAMSANLEDLYQDMEESENLEEGETSRTEVDLNTGQTVDMDGLTAEENAASVTDVVIYNKKGAPWKGRPILSRATSSTLTPEAFEKVKNKYAEFLEALEYDPVEQAFWEQQKEDPVLNPPIITKFLNLKKQNPGIEYSIQQVGTTEDGTPQHIIIQHGQDVGMAQVILSAANDAVEYQKSAKNRAIQAGKKFTPSSWGIVRPIKGNKAGEKTLLNLLNLTPVITAGIFGKHQVVKTHSDGTKGFDTLQAKQEGEPNAVGPVVIKNEGAWLERVQQGFVTMLLGMQDAKIELYYKGKLVTDFNEVADAPIYWHDGKSYSLNQLAKITTPPPDVSLTKRISSLMWQLVNVERQDGGIGDIEASVFPSKWKDSIRTLDWINQLNSMTRASFNAVGVDQVEGGIENMNLPNKKEYNQINTEIVNRMYGYVENKRDLKYIDVSDVQNGDISFGALGFTDQLPEGNTLEYQFGGDITESTTLSSYFSRLAEGYVKGRSPAVVPPTSQIITMIKKFMRFNPAAMEALTNTFPQQLEYTPEVNLDRIREEMGFSKTVVEAPAAPVGSTQGELKLDAALVGERIAEALQRVRDESEVHGHLSDMMVEAGLITPEERAQTVDLGKPDEVYEGGELEQMIDSSAELDPFALSEDIYDRLPLSRFNLEEGPNVIAESKTRQSPADNKSSPIMKGLSYSEKAEAYFDQFLKRNKPYRTKEGKKFTGEESVLAAFSRIVNKDLGLKGSVRVILTSENPNFVIPKKERSFIDEEGNPLVHPNNYIKDVINQMQNPKNADGSRAAPEIGRVVTFGNTHIILLNPESFKKNPNQEKVAMTTLLALAHEIGHPFFDQEYKNLLDGRRKNLLVRLQKDFTKAKLELSKGYAGPGGTEHAYLGERGFEEWYSDQIGRAIIKRARKEPAKTGTDSYFKRVVTKLLQVWNQLNAILRKRFGPATKSVAFEDYIENVIKQHKKANKDNDVLSVNSRIKVRKFIGEVIKPQADKYLSKEQRTWFDAKVKKILTWHESNKLHFLGKEKQHWSMEYLLLPADNYLRRMGPAGAAVADVFYNPSQTEVNQRGHLNARIWYANRRLNKVWDLMEPEKPGNPTAKEIEAFREILFEAEAEIPTSQLSQKAQEVRNYLEELYTEISDLGIKRREIFYPRQYNIPGLMANKNGEQETLIRLLEIYNKGALKQPGFSFREIVNALITNEETSDDNNVDRAKDISIGMAEERSQYFRRIPNEALRWGVDENGVINMKEQETGILLAPEHALKKYVEDMTKRSDYEKRSVALLTREDVAQFKEFGDVGDKVTGWKAMEVLLSRIEDPAKRQGARNAVKGMLGKTGTGMKSWQRQANSLLLTWNITTYLTMATVASLPDLAGTILRSKNLDGLKGFVNQWKTYYKDREAAQAFARDVGVITFDSLDTMYINAAELGFMTPFTKKLSNAYFKTIGLEAFTKFTRVFAAGMGEQFLLRTAQDSSERATVWLKELGITREEVIYWDSHGRTFDTPQGRKVQDAIAQFVDESVVRPNAAERPVWASNPYFALVWQLKSFFFAYGKNIIGGAIRESKTRYGQTGSIPMAAFPLLLGAVPMLILSMIGLEFRELVKYLVGGGDAAKFRTDTMDWGTYFFEIVDRAGILGAFTLLFPMWTAGNYGDEFWISPLGPTAQRAEDFYKGDFGWIDDGLPYLAAVN
jgi:hypothetical protein